MEDYLGMIKIFCGDFAPRGWEFCRGQIKNVNQMRDLFSVIGTKYGGDGTSTFYLPNLQTRAPLGFGQRAGLTSYKLGESGGIRAVALSKDQIPPHSHTFSVSNALADIGTPVALSSIGTPSLMAGRTRTATKGYNKLAPDTQLKISSATSVTGAGDLHSNMQPYLGVNYIICVQGIYPPHP
ncbi:MAG: microcystin dependent protein [Crocinitomicaceae bacterium]|nr:microcystin dependent protein [Crocinitomicaceae bacterium]